ncbi:huntingtin-interacting protein 1-related protein-like [Hypomesus transpacificus]|uniref:huntingtin-interacting protein 1-related protein-like n=1 Tax=Hypomesus transpacificus TaxID=137520 RepID=UPI001F079908|nr:huntingtin-interacting protein 1-related protein-like [Hypomesus transpacificus]
MNTIRQVPLRVKSKRTETNLGAEREHFDKQQLSSISKAINTAETPVKEKHARRIILGTHREKGAFTFWSYALGIPLASNSILSWKFCHVVHKVLRDGHHNVRPPPSLPQPPPGLPSASPQPPSASLSPGPPVQHVLDVSPLQTHLVCFTLPLLPNLELICTSQILLMDQSNNSTEIAMN